MNKIISASLIVLSAISVASASDYIPQEVTSEVYAHNYYQRNTGNCDAASMRRELDNATNYGRAVTTVINCESRPMVRESVQYQRPAPRPTYRARVATCGGDCGTPFEVVTNRRHFVQETREVYRPVVNYVSDGTYTTTREICTDCE